MDTKSTTMDVDLFIANVFKRSPLWDKRDKRHANRMTTDRLWSEIASDMGIEGLKNIMESNSDRKGFQILNLSDSTRQIRVGDETIFELKLVYPLSAEVKTCIHLKEFQDILPSIDVHKSSDEEDHIKCVIPHSSRSLYDLTLKKRLGSDISVYMMLIYKVAETLSKLHSKLLIIGDLSPSEIYVDTKTLKTYIVSLSFLQFVGNQHNTNHDRENESEKILPNRLSSAAPEVISDGRFSKASDIFCLGNVIWVLLTAFDKNDEASNEINDQEIKPFHQLLRKEQFQALMTGKWKDFNTQPICCPDELYRLVLQCVSVNEKTRPSVEQMCEHLKRLFNEEEFNEAILSVNQGSLEALIEENPSEISAASSSMSMNSQRNSKKSKSKSLLKNILPSKK